MVNIIFCHSQVKMISAAARERSMKKLDLNWTIIETCVRRNFGGYFGAFSPSTVFLSKIKSVIQKAKDQDHLNTKELLEEALQAKNNRYLLILTKNNAALKILQNTVYEMVEKIGQCRDPVIQGLKDEIKALHDRYMDIRKQWIMNT